MPKATKSAAKKTVTSATEAAPKKAVKTPVKKAAKKAVKKAVKKPATGDARAEIISSQVVYEGPMFRVLRDQIVEPGGVSASRDLIRHNGSVVILAIDQGKKKSDPWIVVEHQYRHAANQYLWELPAGKLEPGEDPLEGAKRELEEETGYKARKWKLLVEYWPSPGFLGEQMKIFLAEGLIAGEARPEEDERIDFRLVKFSEALKMLDKGLISDGKTLAGLLTFARKLAKKPKK